jgi:hypothetical protein
VYRWECIGGSVYVVVYSVKVVAKYLQEVVEVVGPVLLVPILLREHHLMVKEWV